MIYAISGESLNNAYDVNGNSAISAYDVDGNKVFGNELPIPSGNLTASEVIPLPDLYETGKGFTCTGLAHDKTDDTYLVGDIGILLPNSGTIRSQIVKLSNDFTTVDGTISLYSTFPNMADVQGICIDTSDNTIWLCSPEESLVRHITKAGASLGSISVTRPTGIAYSVSDDSFWILNYNKQILHVSKSGTVLDTFAFAYSETLDQCFLDEGHGYLYITAGSNYSGRNNVYLFDINTHQQSIACTVDSYSVEGIIIEPTRMIIVNDGYYHDALVNVNQANIYDLGE